MSYKVEHKYKLQEKYGIDKYEITLDSPGWNEPVNWFYANCKVSDTKKIVKLQTIAKQKKARLLAQDSAEWSEL